MEPNAPFAFKLAFIRDTLNNMIGQIALGVMTLIFGSGMVLLAFLNFIAPAPAINITGIYLPGIVLIVLGAWSYYGSKIATWLLIGVYSWCGWAFIHMTISSSVPVPFNLINFAISGLFLLPLMLNLGKILSRFLRAKS